MISQLIHNKKIRNATISGVVILTISIFGLYLYSNPDTLSILSNLSIVTLIKLTAAFTLTIVANSLILHFTLSYLDKKTPLIDNLFLTGYSSIVNFFGPLQSGPGFRAIYLNKKYQVKYRQFINATFIFYLFFALINCLILIITGLSQYPKIVIASSSIAIFIPLIVYAIDQRSGKSRSLKVKGYLGNLKPYNQSLWMIGLMTGLLVLASSLVYHIELSAISSNPINYKQSLIYTGAANLALFVSLTPGAIGFRESFLVLSQRLHGIATQDIIAASIIDRAYYVIFLFMIFVLILVAKHYNKINYLIRFNKSKKHQ
ncbi:flippase-like domain-containing protein [Candidatus Saccharibacteria bacterium]|nr:flippase-like domain-containing protein [Candidatus Saccharibacteria bacterium]